MALTVRDPGAHTVDAGNSIVDPRWRGRQIVARLAGGVVELCRAGGFLGFHHYPTTVHPIMQKLAVAGGGVEGGILLDWILSGTDYREIEGGARDGRPAVVVVYQALAPTPPRDVFVPPELAATLQEIHARGRLPRRTSVASAPLPAVASELAASFDPRRGALRLTVERAGRDLAERVGAMLAGSDASVWQVDLAMSDSALGATVAALRPHGFFFAALLPEYADGDVLRLQRIAGDMTPPELVTDDARRLLEAIVGDRARTVAAI